MAHSGQFADLLPSETLEAALRAAENQAQRAEDELLEAKQRAEALRAEASLLRNLLSIRNGSQGVDLVGSRGTELGPHGLERTRPPGFDLIQSSIRELEANKKPMHISELMDALRRRGVSIPGAGNQANVISYLRRDSRIVRPHRGIYALRAWGLGDKKTTRRRKRKARKAAITKGVRLVTAKG